MAGGDVMTFFGWDGSDFDLGRGPVDVVSIVRDLGSPCFVSHKATEGTKTRHTNYGNVIRAARAAGATFTGAYVVPRTPGNNGHGTIGAQVDYLLAYLDAQTPGWRTWDDFFVQVDLEHWEYDNVAPAHGVEMALLIGQRTGKRPILYAPRWAYGDTIGGSHPLWASDYGANPVAHFRAAYPGDTSGRWRAYSGRVPAILQYGSRLTIGNQPGCDANAYRGTVAQFRNMIGGDMAAGDADKAFGEPYTGSEPWVNGRSWVTQAIELPLRSTVRMLGEVLKAQGVAQGDIDAMQADVEEMAARPAATTVQLDPGQLADLKAAIAAAVVADPDTPLSDADRPVIEAATGAALDKFIARFMERLATPQPADGGGR